MVQKIIDGFERYLACDNGDIYDTKLNKNICQWIDNVGYYQCVLKKDGSNKRHYKRVHRLIAAAFIPNPNNLPEVNHIDGNKLNNNVSNLEYTTNSQNTQHGYDNNLYHFGTSKSYPVNVYNKHNHMFIGQYPSIRNMCDCLGLNRKTVSAILNGTKLTNNYDYEFEYVEESQTTIESVSVM